MQLLGVGAPLLWMHRRTQPTFVALASATFAAGAAALGVVLWFAALLPWVAGPRAAVFDHRRRCAGGVTWIRRNVPPDGVVLAEDPAWVSWVTERQAVRIPTGPVADVRRVGRPYDARWRSCSLGSGGRRACGACSAVTRASPA